MTDNSPSILRSEGSRGTNVKRGGAQRDLVGDDADTVVLPRFNPQMGNSSTSCLDLGMDNLARKTQARSGQALH